MIKKKGKLFFAGAAWTFSSFHLVAGTMWFVSCHVVAATCFFVSIYDVSDTQHNK
jgi:hypothetical protein